MNVRRKSTL